MSAPTIPPAGEPQRNLTGLDLLAELVANPYIPEVDDDPRLDEQHHQLEDPATDAAFARLAIDHPDRCTSSDNWTPGGGSRG